MLERKLKRWKGAVQKSWIAPYCYLQFKSKRHKMTLIS